MESPYAGRAIIQDNFDHVVITIPAKKNWFIIIFVGFWMCGWFFGETMASGSIFRGNFGGDNAFEIFWLCGWTVGGIFALNMLLWNLIGKEIVTVYPGTITVRRTGTIFFSNKTYDLNEAKHFRAEQNYYQDNYWGNRSGNSFLGQNNGTIKFEYGMKTIKFADSMDEAEGNYILDILKSKKLIKDS